MNVSKFLRQAGNDMEREAKSVTGVMLIALWVCSLLFITASLMVGHWVNLPHPEAGTELSNADKLIQVAHQQSAIPVKFQSEYHVFHFINGKCPCSRRVFRHLMARKPHASTVETIILVNAAELLEQAQERGYSVLGVTPRELADRYQIEAAPLMIIADSRGVIVYSGGYTSRKRGLDYMDGDIIQKILQGKPVTELPVFGCPVSDDLKAIVDPLHLKSL